MKKKTLAMMLMTTLLLGSILTACSSNNATNGNNQTAANEATVSPEATISPEPTVEPTSTTEPTVSATPSSTTKPSAEPTASAEAKPSTTSKPTKEPAPNKKPSTNVESKPSHTPKPIQTPAPTKKPTPTKAPVEKMPSASDMIDGMLEEVEQPSLMTMDADMMKDTYAIDASLLEEYSIRFPMMNVKATEIAVFKVKNSKNIDAVKEGMAKRAAGIQKQFETYLPDQYENAKNYKVVTNGNYVLFIISESASDLEKAFNTYFDKKK
ncbi:MAG: DUF4358 domain-containing protein [Candidatus Pristimantibacillus sp.]